MDRNPGAPGGAEAEEALAEQALEDLRKNRSHLARVWERSSQLLKRAAELDRRAGTGDTDFAESRPHDQGADSAG